MNKTEKKSDLFSILPPDEIRFVFSRSSGPGGQNVNKVNTRATLIFDLPNSSQFNDEEKAKIRQILRNCLDKNGCIQIHCQQYRSQLANRNAAKNRLQILLQRALRPRKVRKKTKIPKSVVDKRLRDKKHRSEIKRIRSDAPRRDKNF